MPERRLTIEQLAEFRWRYTPDRLAAHLDPNFLRPRHIAYLGEEVAQRVLRGGGRLIINVPPRHGKTSALVWTAAWFLHHWPDGRVIYVSYSDGLARRAGRQVRNIIARHGAALGVELAADASRADEWETTEGGGMWTAGIGGQATGIGADLLIIDDPHRSWADAQSPAAKEAVWDFYTAVLRIRAQPGASIVCAHTRWVPDDLAGRLLEASRSGTGERWDLLRLPALADPTPLFDGGPTEPDLLGRQPGEPLWPEQYPIDAIEAIRATQSRLQFAGLMQQRPTVAEGDVLRRADWQRVDTLPATSPTSPSNGRRGLLLVRRWDLAGTAARPGADPDWTVGALVALDEPSGGFYVVDITRARATASQVRQLVADVAEDDETRFGRGVVQIRGEAEPGSSGKDVAEQYEALLVGKPAKWMHSTGSKETRAEALVAAQQNHHVHLVRAHLADGGVGTPAWWEQFLDEAAAWPNGSHDDQVDAVSQAVNDLAGWTRGRRKQRATLTSVAGTQVRSLAGPVLPWGSR